MVIIFHPHPLTPSPIKGEGEPELLDREPELLEGEPELLDREPELLQRFSRLWNTKLYRLAFQRNHRL